MPPPENYKTQTRPHFYIKTQPPPPPPPPIYTDLLTVTDPRSDPPSITDPRTLWEDYNDDDSEQHSRGGSRAKIQSCGVGQTVEAVAAALAGSNSSGGEWVS